MLLSRVHRNDFKELVKEMKRVKGSLPVASSKVADHSRSSDLCCQRFPYPHTVASYNILS